jgi:hypothetical protein
MGWPLGKKRGPRKEKSEQQTLENLISGFKEEKKKKLDQGEIVQEDEDGDGSIHVFTELGTFGLSVNENCKQVTLWRRKVCTKRTELKIDKEVKVFEPGQHLPWNQMLCSYHSSVELATAYVKRILKNTRMRDHGFEGWLEYAEKLNEESKKWPK